MISRAIEMVPGSRSRDCESLVQSPAAKAARAQAGPRYDNFVAALGRRLSQGPKLRQEIPDDAREDPTRSADTD